MKGLIVTNYSQNYPEKTEGPTLSAKITEHVWNMADLSNGYSEETSLGENDISRKGEDIEG